MQDLIIEYRLQEQQKTENDNDEENDDDDDDVNLQRILNQIGVSLNEKYRQQSDNTQSKSKLSNMIQQLYQTLKKTQPHLFTKTARTDRMPLDSQETNEDSEIPVDENEDEDEEAEEEEVIPLTPEMQQANALFDQANRLMNVTINRQYDA